MHILNSALEILDTFYTFYNLNTKNAEVISGSYSVQVPKGLCKIKRNWTFQSNLSLSRFLLKQSNLRFVIFIIDRISSEQQNTVQWNQERERERREREREREGGRERETEREIRWSESAKWQACMLVCCVCLVCLRAWFALCACMLYELDVLKRLACWIKWHASKMVCLP